jgi:hypothetical protein
MMAYARTYIDPKLYIYTDEEWFANEFVDDFEQLLNSVVSFKGLDAALGGATGAFDVRLCDDLMGMVYSKNPSVNFPPKSFYFKQFTQAILPEILRRASICPDQTCVRTNQVGLAAVANDPADPRDVAFAAHVDVCRSCIKDTPMYLLRGRGSSLANEAVVFSRIVRAGSNSAPVLVDPVYIAPFDDAENRQEKLNVAVKCFAAIESMSDDQWSGTPNNLIATEQFWRSLDHADFRHLGAKYKSRILRSITQIALSIDIDINAHGMTSQTFTYNNRSLNIWNAYVFQSGADDQDRRCSRIYYGSVQGSIVLNEYDPDAH